MSEAWIYPDWPAPAGVGACVTTRRAPGVSAPPYDRCNLGLSAGDDADAVRRNRHGLRAALSLPSAPRWLRQVHGAMVADVDTLPVDSEPRADAAVSRRPGTVLAVLTADCLPVLLCAADGSEIAVAHAGWRGLAAGVLENTVAAMRAPPAGVLAWLGPGIGPRSFEVGEEVRKALAIADPAAPQTFSAGRPGHWYCDLAGLARQRLLAAGVTAVHGGGFDTLRDARFYSYRRDGSRSGRFAALVWHRAGT